MNYTPEQIAEIVLKVLKEVNEPDVLALPYQEKIKLAQNPNASPEILKVLATDKYYVLRYCVAQNPNTSPETLKVLATDEDSCVLYEVKKNPKYKTKTLELTSVQYDALKVLLESSQDESLKTLARVMGICCFLG